MNAAMQWARLFSSSSQHSTHLSYRPDIDGLRAVAILLVVLYHLGRLSKGGYIGVDVFFVISGYLITSIIVQDVEAGTYSLARFYERRVRRILPALFACLLLSSAVASYVLYPAELQFFAKSAIAATFFFANHFFLAHGGYFQPAVEAMPLIHTWSLAVEEQFYLLFPLVLVPLLRRRRSVLIATLALAAIGSLALSQYLVHTDPDSAFYILASRAWELLVGSLLAVGAIPAISSGRNRQVLSLIALVGILVAGFAYTKNTLFPGAAALVPCLGAAILIHTGQHRDTLAYRFLASRPMVGLGLISYSLYLWHVPVITFYEAQFIKATPYSHKLALLVASVLIAALSWRFIEQPFRNRHGGLATRSVMSVAAGLGLAVMPIPIGQAVSAIPKSHQ